MFKNEWRIKLFLDFFIYNCFVGISAVLWTVGHEEILHKIHHHVCVAFGRCPKRPFPPTLIAPPLGDTPAVNQTAYAKSRQRCEVSAFFTGRWQPLLGKHLRQTELQQLIDLLMGLFRGAVFRHVGGALKQPIKEPTETPTSTLALMGRFPSLMGRFPTLMGRFTDFVLRGRFTSWESIGKQPIKKRGIKRFLSNVVLLVSG